MFGDDWNQRNPKYEYVDDHSIIMLSTIEDRRWPYFWCIFACPSESLSTYISIILESYIMHLHPITPSLLYSSGFPSISHWELSLHRTGNVLAIFSVPNPCWHLTLYEVPEIKSPVC